MVTRLRLALLLVLVGLFAAIQTMPVLALSSAQKQLFDNGIYYFDVSAASSSNCSLTPTQTTSASNLDYAGRPILKQGDLALISANTATYQQAAQQVGIPWQVLAAIHYREHGLATTQPDTEPTTSLSGNAIGVYQITDNQNNQKFITRSAYPAQPGVQLTPAQFLQQSVDAANFIKAKEPSLTATPDDATVKDTFVKYNGEPDLYISQAEALGFSADQGYEGSPYVMNLADAQRDNGSGKASSWLQSLGEGVTPQPASNDTYGAFVVYADLSGALQSSSCTGASCLGSTGNNATADLSNIRHTIVCTTNQELQKWSGPSPQLTPATGYLTYSQNRPEDWCADFASWVYNQAGDPLQTGSWNVSYVPDIEAIGTIGQNFHWHPVGSGYTPQPGDLAIHGSSHVNIVVGVSGNQMTLVGGNQGSDDFNQSKVTQYGPVDFTDGGTITGFVSPD